MEAVLEVVIEVTSANRNTLAREIADRLAFFIDNEQETQNKNH